jgi:hypothetical protein
MNTLNLEDVLLVETVHVKIVLLDVIKDVQTMFVLDLDAVVI